MIIRQCLTRRQAQQCPRLHFVSQVPITRHFSSSASRSDDSGIPNHYETLNLPTNASASDIKKQFYTLSKSHHPDLHPHDPSAPQRFVRISEAYATLGSPDKRARYDRDFLRSSPSTSSSGGRSGSYHSSSASTPFGGRPASGLSRRRSAFRGPPPSFYSSGGWGQHSEKRGEYASQSSHTNEAQGNAQSNNNHPSGAGMGPGGFAQGMDNDVPHFNHRAHAQTQSNIERTRHKTRRKRDRRMEDADVEGAGGGSTVFNFLWVGGLVFGITWASGALVGGGREVSAVNKAPREETTS